MTDWHASLQAVKNELDKVSPTFCLAKWLQVTLHLQHGHTHSCHHPIKHKIPLSELKQANEALHNTFYKKMMRKKMLQGEAPNECSYCFKMESFDTNNFSDRIVKSSDHWALAEFDKIKNISWDKNINPTYLEVVFGSECNFRCAYCAPDTSSSLLREFEKEGAYQTTVPLYQLEDMKRFERLPIPDDQVNPYIDAFWAWFPLVYKNLKVLRITGGEPLLNSNLFKLLAYIENNPHPDLEFSINSNACVDDFIFKRFLTQIKKLKLKRLHFYVSLDTVGNQAEYIRFGLNYSKLIDNVKIYLTEIKKPITFMCAFTILSIPRFNIFLQQILTFKKEFGAYQVFLDVSMVCHPMYFSPQLADDHLQLFFKKALSYMKSHGQDEIGETGFLEFEINKVERIYHVMQKGELFPDELKKWRKDFATFFTEYDRRKKLIFKNVFPELSSFFDSCS